MIVDRDHIVMRTWERGAGLTKACGSAACATAVAAVRLQARPIGSCNMTLPGGDLTIEWRERDDHVLMTGARRPSSMKASFDPGIVRVRCVAPWASMIVTFGCRLNAFESEVIASRGRQCWTH